MRCRVAVVRQEPQQHSQHRLGPTHMKSTMWSQLQDISPDLEATQAPQLLPQPQEPISPGAVIPFILQPMC